MVLGQSSSAAVNGWLWAILPARQQIEDRTIEILPTRGLAEMLKGEFITGKVTLRVSMVEMVIMADHLLSTAG
jgi:hypothetical protein